MTDPISQISSLGPLSLQTILPSEATVDLNMFVHRINPTWASEFNYWTYAGSLTTPNCSEAVTWIVAEKSIRITDEQVCPSIKKI